MWIESYETMAVDGGFMMEARVQRSAPDEVHTVTVVEKPSVEGAAKWLWSVESLYGTLIAEGSSPSENEAKSEALTAAKADGGSNDPEALEQALQSTGSLVSPQQLRRVPSTDLKPGDTIATPGMGEMFSYDEEGNINLPGTPRDIEVTLWEVVSNDGSTISARRDDGEVLTGPIPSGHHHLRVESRQIASKADPGRMTQQAAVASEDYPGLSDVLEERPPLEHNAGRFPQDYEQETLASLGEMDLMSPGDDETGLDTVAATLLDQSVRTIYSFVAQSGETPNEIEVHAAYDLLTSDDRLSKSQRGSKAIHLYETVAR